ncbi:SprT family zinc-dependent metalloprotease [Microcoleus sp. S13C4]|uniref:SprT family zinc-dependent metalloprotease n=1 Tax=Microcoleus sp. S13C4 TaxID=3055410 RepID=UPI002FD42D23
MKLDYEIVYSPKRKKLTITVERDRSIVVKAPTGTDLEKIQEVVESRKLWLYEKTNHEQKYHPPLSPPGKELVNGESLPYLGRNYQLELSDSNEEIQFVSNRFLVPKAQTKQRGEVFKNWYIQKAKEQILPRVQIYAVRMGVKFNLAKITDSKYRWGSCTSKNNINFNWRLIKAPMFVINYVIVHELAHLLESNHTSIFWNIVAVQVPNYQIAKNWLRDNGNTLEQDF